MAAGLSRLAAVGGCGPDGEPRTGHCIRELLTGIARWLTGSAMDSQRIFGVRAGDERHGVACKGRRARSRRGLQVREFLDFAEELVKDGALDQPAKVVPLNPGVVDVRRAGPIQETQAKTRPRLYLQSR